MRILMFTSVIISDLKRELILETIISLGIIDFNLVS